MLAAIGLIIMIKQFPIMLGAIVPKEIAKEPLKMLMHTPDIITGLNPEIALIGIISLLVLIVHASIKHPMAKNFPAPIIVVAIAMGLGALFQLDADHNYSFWGHLFRFMPSKVLVVIPNNPLNGITFPDWGKVSDGAFWLSAISIALVQGIETLLTAAAVSEKVDVFKRPVDLSRDVASVGAATIASGAIGGLPMIAEIVRSKANVMVGAKTRWSNFFHGCFMLAFVLLATDLIDHIPLAALAALLIITGYRLASPETFKHTHKIGGEQTIIFMTTIVVTLSSDLLIRVASGILVKLLIHVINGAPIGSLFKADVHTEIQPDNSHKAVIKGAAVFSNYIPIKKALDKLPRQSTITVDLSGCRLVDHTVMDRLTSYKAEYERHGGTMNIVGLDSHNTPSGHPLGMRKLLSTST